MTAEHDELIGLDPGIEDMCDDDDDREPIREPRWSRSFTNMRVDRR